jgi:excisionase family DNA binding protein
VTSSDPLLLTIADVVRATHYSERFVRQLISDRRLAVVRVGRTVRVPRAWLEEWVESMATHVSSTSAVLKGRPIAAPDRQRKGFFE